MAKRQTKPKGQILKGGRMIMLFFRFELVLRLESGVCDLPPQGSLHTKVDESGQVGKQENTI